MKRGYFITFEGPDGAGKSTQIEYLKEYLEDRGLEYLFTREPGGTRISEKIRDMLLDKENCDLTARTEALLYAASRAQLVEDVIQPALNEGKIVVSDRYIDSSIAYQGFGRDLGEKVTEINKFAVNDLEPDLTFLLMISPDDVKARLDQQNLDRLESEDYTPSVDQLLALSTVLGFDNADVLEDVVSSVPACFLLDYSVSPYLQADTPYIPNILHQP